VVTQFLEGSGIRNHEVGSRLFEYRRQLRANHGGRLLGAEGAVAHEAIASELLRRVDQQDSVTLTLESRLEEEGDVAHHNPLAAGAGRFDQIVPPPRDLGVDDGILGGALVGVGKDDVSECGSVDSPVGSKNGGAPARRDCCVPRGRRSDGLAGEDIGIDNRHATVCEEARHGALAARNVSGEADDSHG